MVGEGLGPSGSGVLDRAGTLGGVWKKALRGSGRWLWGGGVGKRLGKCLGSVSEVSCNVTGTSERARGSAPNRRTRSSSEVCRCCACERREDEGRVEARECKSVSGVCPPRSRRCAGRPSQTRGGAAATRALRRRARPPPRPPRRHPASAAFSPPRDPLCLPRGPTLGAPCPPSGGAPPGCAPRRGGVSRQRLLPRPRRQTTVASGRRRRRPLHYEQSHHSVWRAVEQQKKKKQRAQRKK